MAEEEKTTLAAEAEGGKDQGCPVKMYDRQPCGRAIYNVPNGVDTQRVCLMHSRDPNKDDAAFQAEFERILQQAGSGWADFSGFVFRSAYYAERKFSAICIFRGSTFMEDADFSEARFLQDVEFTSGTFMQVAKFFSAKFTQKASFAFATFTEDAEFMHATFTQAADFHKAKFAQAARFGNARFTGDANFFLTSFAQGAHFSEATFAEAADFTAATFTQSADFFGATFRGAARFHGTVFRQDAACEPGPIFSLAVFEKPDAVIFYKTYLGQAFFHKCDVSKITLSIVEWRQRKNGRGMVFEEGVIQKKDDLGALSPPEGSPDEGNFDLVADLYRQLKKNYDAQSNYVTAGDFHYGEMEMKRLATPPAGALLRSVEARKWQHVVRLLWKAKQGWHRGLGVAAWYKEGSGYGESYLRPAAWLAFMVLVFGLLLYPCAGLRGAGGDLSGTKPRKGTSLAETSTVSYSTFFQFVRAEPGGPFWGTLKFFRESIMTTVSVAFFQRDLEYRPAYPWGRALSWGQLLLTYTLAALFLLALRRQFRR